MHLLGKEADTNGVEKLAEEFAMNLNTELGRKCKRISIILNILAPNNILKYFQDLKLSLFGDLKTRNDCFQEGIEYDE